MTVPTLDTFFATPDFMPTGSRHVGQKFRQSKVLAFGWYGGKFSHLDFLRPLFPLDATIFCDVFGGSGSVIFNVGPYSIQIYNDIYPEVVNFFRLLKNPETTETLIREIALTPYSREELNTAQAKTGNSTIECARRFYIRAQQTRNSVAQINTHAAWSYCIQDHPPSASKWASASIRRLQCVARRLGDIQIEQVTALKILGKYDTPETLFYLDPPYVSSTRNDGATQVYKYEMTDQDHIQLAETLQTIQGRAVLSGYRSDLYDGLYRNWNRVDAPHKDVRSGHSVRFGYSLRQECVWKNF